MEEKKKTATLLDTSSDESDGSDKPVPMTGNFMSQVKSMSRIP